MDFRIVPLVSSAQTVRMAVVENVVLLWYPGQTSVCGLESDPAGLRKEGDHHPTEKSDCPVGHLGKNQASKQSL